ncbi:hypothetical protein [Achromobacter sp. RTa]|uniref:helix-turn-helix transcriptional regulator n=1 Tax=Achromobacter sp. RTa TaxID=1532557 RepID=UPI00068D2729|nr:hypothetical protein [Achromobacter sp. RTa]
MALGAASDSFLLDLYACCADASRWAGVLDQLCSDVGAHSAVLQCLDMEGARAVPYWGAYDTHIDMDAYRAEVSDARNPRLEAWRLQRVARRPGRMATDGELFLPEEAPVRDRLHLQLRRAGLGRFMGAMAPMGGTRWVAIAVHQDPREEGGFSPRRMERLRKLTPHLLQAATLAQSVGLDRCVSSLVSRYLEAWPCALLLCDGSGGLFWSNRRAREGLDGRGRLLLRDRRICADAAGQPRFARALAQASQDAAPVFLRLENGQGRTQLALQRLEAPQADGAGLVLVSLVDESQAGARFPVAALRALFDLTEAEARLASALVAGKTVEEYARSRGITVGTARYQLNQVLGKAGAHRQADLVRQVLCSAAAQMMGSHEGETQA